MSLEENLFTSNTSTGASMRHFLIVPSFNPERRHSWGNVVSPQSTRRNSSITSSITMTNADSIR